MRLGRIDLNAYDVIDSNNLEQDLSEKPGPLFASCSSVPAFFIAAEEQRQNFRSSHRRTNKIEVPSAYPEGG